MVLEAGQATRQLEEKLQAESEKRQQAEKEVGRLQDELLKKEEELKMVKSHHADIQVGLKQSADDAESKFQEMDKRLTTLKKSVHQFVASVFGKSVLLP